MFFLSFCIEPVSCVHSIPALLLFPLLVSGHSFFEQLDLYLQLACTPCVDALQWVWVDRFILVTSLLGFYSIDSTECVNQVASSTECVNQAIILIMFLDNIVASLTLLYLFSL